MGEGDGSHPLSSIPRDDPKLSERRNRPLKSSDQVSLTACFRSWGWGRNWAGAGAGTHRPGRLSHVKDVTVGVKGTLFPGLFLYHLGCDQGMRLVDGALPSDSSVN